MRKPIYLIVTSFFPSPKSWRCAFAYDYAKAIERDGRYRVVVFKPGDGYEYEGIRVVGFKSFSLPSGIPCPFLTPINIRHFRTALVRSGLDPCDVKVAESYTNGRIPHLLALKKLNPKIFVVAHHHDPASFGVFDGRFRQFWPFKIINYFMRRHAYERADLHVYISEVVKRSFLSFPKTDWSVYRDYARLGSGLGFLRAVRVKRDAVVHNGVDRSIFYPREGDRRENSTFTIGCIGNFIDWKNQIQLLRAAALLKTSVRLIFVGSGPELSRCRRFANEHGLDVEFRSEVRHEELAEFYRSLDLFCLPSYFEGFGCVFTEAWASGTPFITCEGQGMDDLIDLQDRHLWLAKPNDSADLAAKIQHYIDRRPRQHLIAEIDIDKIIPAFLDDVERWRG